MSKDRQTELATEVHVGAVFCRNCDHVSGLQNLPAKANTQAMIVERYRMMIDNQIFDSNGQTLHACIQAYMF